VRNSNFISVRFLTNLESVWNAFGFARFEKTVQFGYCSYLVLM